MAVNQIAFRTDASNQIGTGHFMRCLTLADGLKQRGAKIRFVSRYLPEYLRSMLMEKGYEVVLHDSAQNNSALDELAHANWLKVSQAQDATETIQVLSDETWDWIIVDHYALDARWESMLRQTAKMILVIDDIADRQHECDILLDQNAYGNMKSRYELLVPEKCIKLLGPQYSLLRDEFDHTRAKLKNRDGTVNRILIFFGGMDITNETAKALKAIEIAKLPDNVVVDVVVGGNNKNLEIIRNECIGKTNIVFHCQVNNMAELMASADLAFGAGGSATWERCFLGLPTINIVTADNQAEVSEYLHEKNVIYNMGVSDSVTADKLAMALDSLTNDQSLLRRMSENALSLFTSNQSGKSLVVSTLMRVH
jgi:UDP-2,4-diacetamido-2,4,6-trideoxy-beta-L-altropyranose hydrolase